MLDNGLAYPFVDHGAAGNGDAMLLGLARDDVDEIVIGEHVGEFEQRPGDFDVVIGELEDDGARRPVEPCEKAGHMGPGLDLDQFGELAQHLVILGHLLVVAAVRDVAEELRHVAEKLVALGVVLVSVQHAEAGKGAVALIKLAHCVSPGFCRCMETRVRSDLLAWPEGSRPHLTKLLATPAPIKRAARRRPMIAA